jgi:hypothetical protein
MRQVIRLFILPLVLLGFWQLAVAQNENEVSFGNYVANFNTFPSNFLDAKIAAAIHIKRSESSGVITIAVRQHVKGSPDKSVKADVNGTATTLIGQISNVKFKEVRDGGVLYYMGTFTITQNEKISFNVTILPEGELHPYQLSFTRQF